MKIGLSCAELAMQYGYEKGLEIVKQSGFDAVDISLLEYIEKESVFDRSEDEFYTHFSNIKKICDNLELEISQTHGLTTISVPDSEKTQMIKKQSELMLKASAILGAPYIVFHNAKIINWEHLKKDGEFLLNENSRFFEDFLTPLCEKYNVSFAMETHGRIKNRNEIDFIGDVRNLKESYDRIKSDFKAICLDTGHTNEIVAFGTPDVPESIRILGNSIKVLHLHDNEGNYDSHLPPLVLGKNNIDWHKTFDTLSEIGYDGVYNYELNLRRFGSSLCEITEFLGKFLRTFTENKGRLIQ